MMLPIFATNLLMVFVLLVGKTTANDNCVALDENNVKSVDFDDLKTIDLACDPDDALNSLTDVSELRKILLKCSETEPVTICDSGLSKKRFASIDEKTLERRACWRVCWRRWCLTRCSGK